MRIITPATISIAGADHGVGGTVEQHSYQDTHTGIEWAGSTLEASKSIARITRFVKGSSGLRGELVQ